MTDLYEALRAAVTPDGRVRLTRELLTAMHEEGERRERGESVEVWRERAFAAEGALTVRLAVRREIEEALGMVPGLTDDQALQRGLDAVRMLRERAEKAERELGEARARIEAAGNVVSDNGCDCACDHSTLHEDHDEDCEVCVVCRVADALWPEAGR